MHPTGVLEQAARGGGVDHHRYPDEEGDGELVTMTNTSRTVMTAIIVHDVFDLLGDGGSQYNFVDPLAHQPGDQETW